MEIQGEHLVFLLGAGASADANIKMSTQMVNDIEHFIRNKEEWKPYADLYYYLKSSIHYADGIFGRFGESFNVEKLLIVISEIEKRDKNLMYPFIGAWNIRLIDLAGNNFENISHLQKLIRKQLNEWVRKKHYNDALYYNAFNTLQGNIQQLIKIFTLNYDLCFERIVGPQRIVETGFSRESREWNSQNFENNTGKHFFLFKLHGSIDWYMEDGKLKISDDPVENPELIFGIQHKMTSVDPYFYYLSKLREACRDARLIVVIGYSFADDHINGILSQALKDKDYARLLNVGPAKESNELKENIRDKLFLPNTKQIILEPAYAKTFMTTTLSREYLAQHIAEPDDVPFK